MPRRLTPEQVTHFREHGFVSPVEALSAAKAAEYRQRLEEAEQKFGPIQEQGRHIRPHLLFRWASDLVHEPAIVDALADLIGDDVLIYTLRVWPKAPGSPEFVSWHQDHTYHMLDCDSVSAWVSLSDTTIQAGCMEVVPGSHKAGELEYVETAGDNNMLFKGQTVIGPNPEFFANTAFMPLKPGQLSLHHSRLVHRSAPNQSTDRRIGIAINCIPTNGKCISGSGVRLSASLIRGHDRFGNFDLESPPEVDYDEEARRMHQKATRSYAAMQKHSFPDSFD